MSGGSGRRPLPGGAHGGPATARLEAGALRTQLTAAGTGGTWFGDYALSRWRDDPIEDVLGWRFQVHDRGSGACWPIGRGGPADVPARLTFGADAGHAVLTRAEDGLEARLDVRLEAAGAFEARRVTLRNTTDRPRTVELTTFLEVSLQHPAADAGHPAFSKLFVQTESDPARCALLARRRPRANGEHHPWLLLAAPGPGAIEWETDRARYLGRGDVAHDRARLLAPGVLAGTTGNVLDPVFALRRVIELAPGAGASLDFVLAAAPDREAALRLAEAAPGRLDGLFGAGDGAGTPVASEPAPARFEPASVCDGGAPEGEEALRFDNGCGGFSAAGSAYVMRVHGRDGAGRPPQPWVNVIANERMGFLVSESGAASTWGINSREYRLTPWSNDPVLDPYGEALYVRDEDAGSFWSPLPGPVACGGAHEVRHELGESRFRHAHAGIEHDTRLFVAREDPVRFCRVRLVNRSPRARRITLFGYQRLVLGALPETDAARIVTAFDASSGALFAAAPAGGPFAGRIAFASLVQPEGSEAPQWTTDRMDFLGVPGDPRRPAALAAGTPLAGAAGPGLDPCFVWSAAITLAPGEETERTFLLGDAADAAEARAVLERCTTPGAVEAARAEATGFWRKLVSGVRIETPEPALDLMVNAWLPYQALSGRMLGRTAFYQSSGAFGFRDQLQDASGFAMLDPARFRRQILLHASHQFLEGDVLHWWHPPQDRGMRTRFADDLLWLPYLTAGYVAATGDASVLDERAPYLTARALGPDEDEAFIEPRKAGRTADVYTHACAAIDRSLGTGAHGLPLFGSGDWNDGMNRVGHEGRGESVWMAFFLIAVLDAFAPLCERRGDHHRASQYRAHAETLQRAVEAGAWDGGWYLRAYDDDGLPLGTHADDECRIDGLVQAWSVISGAAPASRAEQALDAVESHLIAEGEGLIRLLTPPFEHTPRDPGYIKGYVKGVRENGGQYTHAALWIVRAFAEAGRRDRAASLLTMLSPVSHTRDAAAVARYRVEPYVIAADVYGAEPHVGRGGWTWYTGSASWMYRVALESVLGIAWRGGRTLRLRSRIPDAWPSCRVEWRVPESATRYRIAFEREAPGGIRDVTLDGEPVPVRGGEAHVPLVRDERTHEVRVTLGGSTGSAPRQTSRSRATDVATSSAGDEA